MTAADDLTLRAQFVGAMSHAAMTVTVVTTDGMAGRAGITVSAMAPVSADGEWPTLLVCVNRGSRSSAKLIANGVFCVNVLREDQSAISDAFASQRQRSGEEKFSSGMGGDAVGGSAPERPFGRIRLPSCRHYGGWDPRYSAGRGGVSVCRRARQPADLCQSRIWRGPTRTRMNGQMSDSAKLES